MAIDITCSLCGETRSGEDSFIRFYFWDFVTDAVFCCNCVPMEDVGIMCFPLFMAIYSDSGIFATMVSTAYNASHFVHERFNLSHTQRELISWQPYKLSDHDTKYIRRAKRFCIEVDVKLKRALRSLKRLREVITTMRTFPFRKDQRDAELMQHIVDIERRLDIMRTVYGEPDDLDHWPEIYSITRFCFNSAAGNPAPA